MAHYEALGCLLGLLGTASDSIIMSFNVAGTNSPTDLPLNFLDVDLAFKQITIKVSQDPITFRRYKEGRLYFFIQFGESPKDNGLTSPYSTRIQDYEYFTFLYCDNENGVLGQGGNQIAWSADWRRFGQAANERRPWPQPPPLHPLCHGNRHPLITQTAHTHAHIRICIVLLGEGRTIYLHLHQMYKFIYR